MANFYESENVIFMFAPSIQIAVFDRQPSNPEFGIASDHILTFLLLTKFEPTW